MADSRPVGQLDERLATFLDLLERRRQSLDQSMWQAPALTIAGQAFLLRVLTDENVVLGARLLMLFAGVMASLAALLSLMRLGRARCSTARPSRTSVTRWE